MSKCSHTLFSPAAYDAASKRLKMSYGNYGSFCKLFLAMGPVRSPLPAPSKADMPQVIDRFRCCLHDWRM